MIKEIRHLEDDDVVVMRTEGSYVLEAEIGTLEKLRDMLNEYGCHKLLIDHRQTDVVVKTLEAYHRPEVYEEIWGDPVRVRGIRTAIVFKQITEDYRFLETVIRNRGGSMRVFDDYDIAWEWLTK